MNLQEAVIDRDHPHRPYAHAGEYMVSAASNFARIVQASNAQCVATLGQWVGGGSTSVGQGVTIFVYSGDTPAAAQQEYDPEFVADILAADAAPPEASFDNVVDMLDWLNRE